MEKSMFHHRIAALILGTALTASLLAGCGNANTIYGGAYPFYPCGNTSSFALNTGRFAGKHVAALLRRASR